MSSLSFRMRVEQMVRETGKSYSECCRILGQHGGKASAAKRARVAQERRNQVMRRVR